jgi:hypothetical protein
MYNYPTTWMYSHEPSPLGCDAVLYIRQPEEGVNQHCDLRHKLLGKHHKKSKPIKPEPNTAAASTVASCFARGAATDLRALILAKRAHRISKAGGAVSAKEFKNGYDAEHNHITSEPMFETRQEILKSDYSFKVHRVVSGDKVTVILN